MFRASSFICVISGITLIHFGSLVRGSGSQQQRQKEYYLVQQSVLGVKTQQKYARHRFQITTLVARHPEHNILAIRGGDTGKISAKTMAKIFTFFAGIESFSFLFLPQYLFSLVGVTIIKGSFLHYFIQSIGASAGVVASCGGILLTQEGVPKNRAIAMGLSIRVLFYFWTIISHMPESARLDRAGIFAGSMPIAVTTFSLFTGKLRPTVLVKCLSVLYLLMAILFRFRPQATYKAVFGQDLEATKSLSDKSTMAILAFGAAYHFMTFALVLAIASGVKTARAIAFAALCALGMVIDYFFGTQTFSD